MNKNGPIILIGDSDQKLFSEIFHEIGVDNELLFFDSSSDAIQSILHAPALPFIIFVKVGPDRHVLSPELAFRGELDQHCQTPVIILSSDANKLMAFDGLAGSNGAFEISENLSELRATMAGVIDYWTRSVLPHSVVK